MIWTCTTCGNAADAVSVGALDAIGWCITEPASGVCPMCSRRARHLADSDLIRARVRETRRVATEMLERARSESRNIRPS
jgi:hypothetical protein